MYGKMFDGPQHGTPPAAVSINMFRIGTFGSEAYSKEMNKAWLSGIQQRNEQSMVIQPAVCFSVLLACEELTLSFIRQKPNNIMLRQQTFFNINEQKNSIYAIHTSR